MSEPMILLQTGGAATLAAGKGYRQHEFEVPPGLTRLTATLRYHKRVQAQLHLALFDSEGFRGCAMRPHATGEVVVPLLLDAERPGPGGLPGPIRPGPWRALVDIEAISEDTIYSLVIWGETNTADTISRRQSLISNLQSPLSPALAGPGWYGGEIHCHSVESDGRASVADMVAAAHALGLDFLAITDHFSHSAWYQYGDSLGQRPVLIRALEITAHCGHANLYGLKEWVDVYVDRPDWTINDALRATHEQGGLFSINHPFGGDLSWRYHQIHWSDVDCLELCNGPMSRGDGAGHWQGIAFWDHHLRCGRRLIGIGGTDAHDIAGPSGLGTTRIYVYCPELSETGFIAGLHSGRVFVTYGPRLDFWAEGNRGSAPTFMGSQRPWLPGETLKLHVQLEVRQPSRVYLYKNGLYETYQNVFTVAEGRQEVVFSDSPDSPCYYRVEVHAGSPEDKVWMTRRGPASLLAISNPIFIGSGPYGE